MFPRGLLLMLLLTCILYEHSYAQEVTTDTPLIVGMKEGEIVSIAMACAILSVLVVLIPTALYYKLCVKEEITE